ncbi:hypothetical protein P691DRAFT_760927 [Macrolepiota fuliginosa MF-IS2]|uniref:Transmembrane protein 188 n=1 Tax=Macrolepiota fuliginosa MF-IS2 TaxID=1400762 RepID=A0A9P5XAV5_9AGAR|nr:hypothetical protein P691DRAFT_760927 [Macrolepiota fuliginosa MF-IS2]
MPPTADHATFRDLNIFEQRLKETAANLQRRKSKYQFFLGGLLIAIALLLLEVFLPPNLLVIPCKMFLCWLLPEAYLADTEVTLHPYFTSGLLFVSVTILVLIFVSGMYSEKIAYANKYVPHANRSLRSFNMYFNTRKPPLGAKFYWSPLSIFFPRPEEHTSRSPSPPSRDPSNRTRSQSASRPIPSIPPAANPRGELIFSSRVEKTFREGYDRYRAVFDKKQLETDRQKKEQAWMERWGWLYKLRFWAPPPLVQPPPVFSRTVSSSSSRGRGGGSRSGTPPTPGSSSSGRQRDRSGSPMGQPRSTGRRSPNRKVAGDAAEKGNRRGFGDEGDMRMQALERSLAQGSSS